MGVQVELRMLDPYVRKGLKYLGEGEALVTAPDVNGVFKFQLDYQRPGLTHIHLEEPAPIRPYRHDEFERFIPAAFPYYAAIAGSGRSGSEEYPWRVGGCAIAHSR